MRVGRRDDARAEVGDVRERKKREEMLEGGKERVP